MVLICVIVIIARKFSPFMNFGIICYNDIDSGSILSEQLGEFEFVGIDIIDKAFASDVGGRRG